VWQSLCDATRDLPFTVLAVALDAAAAVRPWLEAASPTFPCLVDREHRVAELYNLVNVPQAIWIDENGRMVRPPEVAGSSDGFRSSNRVTNILTDAALAERARVKAAYFDAVRDWAVRGVASPYALDAKRVMERLAVPDATIAEAHARFRLGQLLAEQGRGDEANAQFAEAARLHPDSWAIWRQNAARDARGFAVNAEFWARVDALGDRRYYPRADLPGVSSDKQD
jgi:hypothetical protein